MPATAFVARRQWVAEEGLRLDAGAYAGGALAVRDRIVHSDKEWRRLGELCNLSYPGRFARRYVNDPDHGVPFLSSSDILLADIKGVPYLAHDAVAQSPELRLSEGWTLISRSGTVGNTAYVREEMAGLGASEHVIRAVPAAGAIAPGYLFAFLSSRHGRMLIQSQTYGTVVRHIEPHHLADIPVPLPDPTVQQRIHDLVAGAAAARTEASRLLDEAGAYFDGLAGPLRHLHDHARAVGTVQRSTLNERLDGFHHVGWAAEAKGLVGRTIGDMATVSSTNRVPRIYTAGGVPFLSGIDIFRIRPTARVRLAKYVADAFNARISRGDLAVQGSGQRYGLIGQAAFVGHRLDGWSASHDLFRIRAHTEANRAEIFAFIRSGIGRRAMLLHSYGTSIPHVNPAGISAVTIPRLPEDELRGASRALALREQADADEEQAIREVESWLT